MCCVFGFLTQASTTTTNDTRPTTPSIPTHTQTHTPHTHQFLFVATTPEGSNDQQQQEARISHPRVAVIARRRSAAKFVQSYVDVGAPLLWF